MTAFTPIVDGVTPVNASAVNQRLYELASLFAMASLGVVSQGRLSLTTQVPVTTSDVTAATTLRFVPYTGNKVLLYNGSGWDIHTFSELSLSLSGFTANKNFDIFLYNNSGTLTLEALVWTNDTTRATALTRQNGIVVKDGDATRLYLGTIRTTNTTGQCEDSYSRRFVWNFYNRIGRIARFASSSSHTYATTTYRPWNNDAASIIEAVIGVAEDAIMTQLYGFVTAGTQVRMAIGYNSTTTPGVSPIPRTAVTTASAITAASGLLVSAGYVSLCLLEFSNGTSTLAEAYLGMVLRG